MRITRLFLRNFRVYEGDTELEVPAGLVGVYGVNGAGKSALLDSIRWTLYGQARTAKDEIRTSGVNADCITEVEFEHEGHLYLVRRTISGVNHTVKAEAHWNNQQAAEGVRDVASYVHSILGMDDAAFRASVFAEQKQIAAFSAQNPAKRRELVLRLLGITPLDKARDAARADARDARKDHERISQQLPDLGELTDLVAAAEQHAANVDTDTTAVALAEAQEHADVADALVEELNDVARTYEALVADGRAAAAVVAESAERVEALVKEQQALAGADADLGALRPLADGVDTLEAVLAAQLASEALHPADEPPSIDEPACEATIAMAAQLAGEVNAAEADLVRAVAAANRSADLSPDEDCPVCGQALGEAFEQVVTHRQREVADATKRLAAAKKAHTAAVKAAKAATKTLEGARAARATWDQYIARRREIDATLSNFVALAVPPTANATKLELEARKRAVTEVAKLEARLERAPIVAVELATTEARLAEATQTRDALRDKVKALGFKPDDLVAAKTTRQAAREVLKSATKAAEAARQQAATASAAVEAAKARLTDAEAQHARIADLADRARHLGRLGDLLHDFRNNVVSTVGPRLAAQAADLFAELTDHEYDQLEVDPDTYEIQIRDGGRVFGMDRFSGSEIDLANLALRVAISEHVRFQSGGAVGLLVLDEVFGPLDDERKERMLLALERLRGRFRQVLVVTHDGAIKEQLPNAILVEKLPGRRARASVLS